MSRAGSQELEMRSEEWMCGASNDMAPRIIDYLLTAIHLQLTGYMYRRNDE